MTRYSANRGLGIAPLNVKFSQTIIYQEINIIVTCKFTILRE